MPSLLRQCLLLALSLLSYVCANNYVHDKARSVALIEMIDRESRSIDPEFDRDSNFLDDHGHAGHEDQDPSAYRFTNEWVVKITGGPTAAARLAEEMGYEIIGEVPNFPELYRLHKLDHPRRGRAHSADLSRQLSDDVRVMWAEQQFAKRRQKRGIIPPFELEEIEEAEEDLPLVRVKRTNDEDYDYPPFVTEESETEKHDGRIRVKREKNEKNLSRNKREDLKEPRKPRRRFNDILWDHQWYLHDTRTLANLPRLDLNVLPVYDMGYTGKGVTVLVLDDGIETNHTDLKKNYVAEVSYDINDDDSDPTPRYGRGLFNSHGTRCAGEIAMEANNVKCGVGVAYNVGIGGVRMLDGAVSDRVEASSLIHQLGKVDIYSASWGPTDDGKTVEGPGRLARQSLYRGVTEGRNGKGAIFIWAAGNGGRTQDNCNCDGYVSSIYTVAIGSVSKSGSFPWYGEMCASTMAVTYSSGAYTDQKIATVDLNDKCTTDHTGTSAAAPLAAGIVALALEANPNLTWRDVQHLFTWTSEYKPLEKNYDWKENSAGFRVNLRVGFGLVNAHSFVKAALNWTSVPAKSICTIAGTNTSPVLFTNDQWGGVEFKSDNCKGTPNEVNYLEHVEVIVNIEYPVRGRLEIDLISPSGTTTQVLKPRRKDTSTTGFINWPFMSLHTWGENPEGLWKIIVTDMSTDQISTPLSGRIVNATLVLHGTSALPEHRKNGARIYDDVFSQFPSSSHRGTDAKLDREKENEWSVDVNQLRSKNPNFSWKDLIGLKLLEG